MMWRHVIISTRRSWLHGDQRGFRSRGHRIHSSGDYQDPPPPGEHAGLLRYHQRRLKGKKVKIPRHLRAEIGVALLYAVLRARYRVLVIAVTQKHAHVLVELPRSRKTVARIVGKWKSSRTSALRKEMPGSIWGEGGKYKPVKTRSHLAAAYKYIRDDQGPGARVWDYRGGVPDAVKKLLSRDAARAKSCPAKPRAQRSGAPDSSRRDGHTPGKE
jgi:hypothetical protein